MPFSPTAFRIGLCVAGLLTICAGSFLPWVRSGAVLRNSFEIAGIVDRIATDGKPILSVAMSVWIVVPVSCVLGAVFFAIGARNSATTVTIVVSIIAGTVGMAGYVLGHDNGDLINAVPAGPLTTGLGAALALTGALSLAVDHGGRSRADDADRPYRRRLGRKRDDQ